MKAREEQSPSFAENLLNLTYSRGGALLRPYVSIAQSGGDPVTEQEAIAKIHSVYPSGKKEGLTNMRALMARLGNAQERLLMVHVAGTNGKGSTCAMIERMLREAGYKTGLYTSPYIEKYNERIRIDGEPISGDRLAALVERVWPAVEECQALGYAVTEFELGTALAFLAFEEAKADVAIIEVGLGGRLDPTNIITPAVCVIAGVGLDHMQFLGDTIEEIAAEKAGIMKPGVPVVLGAQASDAARSVLLAHARSAGCHAAEPEAANIRETADGVAFDAQIGDASFIDLCVGLPGRHQAQNACAALGAVLALRDHGIDVDENAVRRGLAAVRWPGRLEWFGNVLLDGAHNEHGVHALRAYCAAWLKPEKTVLLTGMMQDKAINQMAEMLAPLARLIVAAQPDIPRALDARTLAAAFEARGCEAIACAEPRKALALARELAGEDGTVLAAGSLYLIGALRAILREEREFCDVV